MYIKYTMLANQCSTNPHFKQNRYHTFLERHMELIDSA